MPMSRNGKDDMFWDQPFDTDAMKKWCWDTWKVVPRPMWPEINWGGHRIETASNIVFSNGKLDPWSGGGILEVRALNRIVCFPEGQYCYSACHKPSGHQHTFCYACRTSAIPLWLW